MFDLNKHAGNYKKTKHISMHYSQCLRYGNTDKVKAFRRFINRHSVEETDKKRIYDGMTAYELYIKYDLENMGVTLRIEKQSFFARLFSKKKIDLISKDRIVVLVDEYPYLCDRHF